jgi:HAD superfamily hydrolase (TIGR01509 family)
VRIRKEKWELFGKLQASLDFNPGFVKFVNAIKAEGIPIALATSSTQQQLNDLFKNNPITSSQLVLEDTFDIILRREDVKQSKPDKEIYVEAAKRLGVKSEECLGFEDSYEGIRALLDAGIGMPVLFYNECSEPYMDRINEALNNAKTDTYKLESFEDLFET